MPSQHHMKVRVMPYVQAVIGAQFGDEGKGLVTDALVHRALQLDRLPVVVRANGGAQAAHTVVTPEGVRHVFHHFGSGTLCGVPTHVTRDFIINPIQYGIEYRALAEIGVTPTLTYDPQAIVTLPCDMLINQIAETLRGANRHGSCGMGINETIVRGNHEYGFAIFAKELGQWSLADFMKHSHDWARERLCQLKITDLPPEYRDLLFDDGIVRVFYEDVQHFLKTAQASDDRVLADMQHLIFEGAQGLALDEEHSFFPHVTRSRTGLTNVVKTCRMIGNVTQIEANYVTRSYTTRHGAGPLPGECDISDAFAVVDPTNQPNEWQGSLRFAYLDIDFLTRNIANDLAAAGDRFEVRSGLVLTCLDQAKSFMPMIVAGRLKHIALNEAADFIRQKIGLDDAMESWSPTRHKLISSVQNRENEKSSVLR